MTTQFYKLMDLKECIVFCQQHADPQNDLPSVKPLSGVFHSYYRELTKPRQAYFSGVKTKEEGEILSQQAILYEQSTSKNGPEEGYGRQTRSATVNAAFS